MTSQMPRSTERLSGVWALLGPPRVLALLRRAIGARAAQRELADRYVDAAPGARVLDLGCGLGGIYPHLPRGVTF